MKRDYSGFDSVSTRMRSVRSLRPTSSRRWLAGVLLALLVSPARGEATYPLPSPPSFPATRVSSTPVVVHGQNAENAPIQQWKVEYVLGTERVRNGSNVRLLLTHQILGLQRGNEVFSIPPDTVVAISYDNIPRRPLMGAADFAFEMGDTALAFYMTPFWGGLVPVAVVVVPFIAAGLMPLVKTKGHFVHIVWQEDGTVKDVLLRVDRREREFLLEELEARTGQQSKHLPNERERIRSVLKARKEEGISIQIEREVWVSNVELQPGPYKMVFLQRSDRLGDLYLFAGQKVKPGKVSAQTLVRIERNSDVLDTPEVLYREVNNAAGISRIQTSGQTLWFESSPLPTGRHHPVQYGQDTAIAYRPKSGTMAVVSRVTYDEEPAFRFPVMHLGFGPSAGFLYITPSQISYEPTPDGRLGLFRRHVHRSGFTASLDGAVQLEKSKMLGGIHLKVRRSRGSGMKIHRFRPLYQAGLALRPTGGTSRKSRQADAEFVEFAVLAASDFQAADLEFQQLAGQLPGQELPGWQPPAPAPRPVRELRRGATASPHR